MKKKKPEEIEQDTLRKFINKYKTQRDLMEESLISFCESRKYVETALLSDELDNLEYFNKKIAKAIKRFMKINNERGILSKFGIE